MSPERWEQEFLKVLSPWSSAFSVFCHSPDSLPEIFENLILKRLSQKAETCQLSGVGQARRKEMGGAVLLVSMLERFQFKLTGRSSLKKE